ncbi:GntR family transcriptional regulator [Xanthobacter sediminis]
MQIAAESHAPKYARIADVLRQRIARGVWPKAARVPTNDDLAQEFGVSRVTIRQAVDILTREGLLEAQQGRGTFVRERPREGRWLSVQTSLDALGEMYSGTRPQILNISESEAHPPLLPGDGTPAEGYVYMKRVHFRDDAPYCVIAIYLDKAIFDTAPEAFRSDVVIPLLMERGAAQIAKAWQTLVIGSADLDAARLLNVPLGSPIVEVRRVFNDGTGRVIYLGEVTYRGDFVRIDMNLKP